MATTCICQRPTAMNDHVQSRTGPRSNTSTHRRWKREHPLYSAGNTPFFLWNPWEWSPLLWAAALRVAISAAPPSLGNPPTIVIIKSCANILPLSAFYQLNLGARIILYCPEEIMESVRDWISEHKLASIGSLWTAAVGGSLLYTGMKSSLKPSLRLIHARMHAQALTLAVLSSAAAIHYYEKKHEAVEQ